MLKVLIDREAVRKESIMWFIYQMDHMRYIFTSTTGKEPKGWLMGLEEYLNFKAAVCEQMNEDQRNTFKNNPQYQGLPVYIKSSRGIELEMDLESARKFQRVRQDMAENKKTMI